MKPDEPGTGLLPNALQRVLELYRDGTSPSDGQRARLWSRLGETAVAPLATSSVVLRVVIGGALIGTLGAIGLAMRDAPERSTPSAPIEAPSRATATLPANTTPATAPATPPVAVSIPNGTAPPIADAVARPRPRPSGTATASPGLADEIALLERARIALGHGRPHDALRELAEHERTFPRGTLIEERVALRVIALCDAGNPNEGRSEGAAFLSAHPSATLAGRIRSACALAQ